MPRRRGGALALAFVVLTGCTVLTSAGDFTTAPATESPDGASTDDASAGADVLAPPVVDGCSEAACFDMPAGFSLVAFGATAKGAGCPGGFGSPLDTVEAPTVLANGCSCGCNVTASPSCQQGVLAGFFSTNAGGSCGSDGADFDNDGCGTEGYLGPFGAENRHRYTPPNPSGGSCSANAVKDDTKLSFAAEGRVCQPTAIPMCAGKVCPAALGGGPFLVCIASPGDVACPSGFGSRHLVGSSASFTCGAGCTCNVTAGCPGGVLNFYATTNCTGAVGFSYAVNNTCVLSEAGGASFNSYRYVANAATNVACARTGSTTPSTPVLAQASTVCCR